MKREIEKQSIAIAHGALTSDGGAQRVAVELARAFDAPIYCFNVDQNYVPDDVEAQEVMDGRWADFWTTKGRKPAVMYWLGRHLYTMQRASHLSDLYEYDVVIQSKPEMGWLVQRDEQTIVRYVHHGFRRHYGQFFRMGTAMKNRLWSLFIRTVSRQTVDYPHLLIANSETTAQRTRDHWSVRDDRLRVCYPPVRTTKFDPAYDVLDEDYYLVLGRLADNKRVAEVARAFRDREETLVIAGDGPRREAVEQAADAASNIRIEGYVSEERKRELLASARALVMNARHEDFGMVPIEAMASGTPVIGVDEPFTNKQIINECNGLTYTRGDAGLNTALDEFERHGVYWSAERIAEFADRFSVDRFRDEMREHVATAVERSRVRPQWDVEAEREVVADGGRN